MENEDEASTLYLQLLDRLEREIQRQRKVLTEHGVPQRNKRAWDAVRRKHDLKAAPLADHKHVVQEMMEELRFDVDVLVQDFRRFFLPVGKQQARKIPDSGN